MAGKVRHLLNRQGRYFARLVIPKDIRHFMGEKTELCTALGADYRTALKLLPGAVANLQHEIALGERRGAGGGAKVAALGHRFQRLYDVFGGPCSIGASHHRKPLRLMNIMPLRTRRSSTLGTP